MSLSKPIKINEGISLNKAIKLCYRNLIGKKLNQEIIYSIIFLDRLDENIYFIIRFSRENNSLTYGLKYLEGD